MDQRLLDDLLDWLRIPSISTGGGDPADLERAAAWVVERVSGAGGDARVIATDGNPLAVGDLRATSKDAPTVLIYGHYDVQSVGDPRRGRRRPSRPTCATAGSTRGAHPTTRATSCRCCTSRARRRRRARCRSTSACSSRARRRPAALPWPNWVRADERGADCAIVFDSGMVDERTPAITIGLRGLVMLHLRVRTADRDLHSGVYGGSALNALHALHLMLAAVVPGADGRLRDELLAGAAPPAPAERESWTRLPPGDEVLAAAGARPAYPGAGAEYYERNGAQPSLEINAIHAGDHRTVVPAVAEASVSQRLAPGQSARAALATLERLLRDALAPGAELEIEAEVAEPSLFPPDDRAVALSAQALERAVGAPAAFVRSGGSIPVVAEFAARGIPTVVSGFGLEDDAYHAHDESFRLVALDQGAVAADELYKALATL